MGMRWRFPNKSSSFSSARTRSRFIKSMCRMCAPHPSERQRLMWGNGEQTSRICKCSIDFFPSLSVDSLPVSRYCALSWHTILLRPTRVGDAMGYDATPRKASFNRIPWFGVERSSFGWINNNLRLSFVSVVASHTEIRSRHSLWPGGYKLLFVANKINWKFTQSLFPEWRKMQTMRRTTNIT